VPKLGLVRTSLVFGALNGIVGLWGTWLLRPLIKGSVTGLRVRSVLVLTLLVIALIKADWLTSLAEDELYPDPILYTQTTAYQRITVTSNKAGFQLFLNGNLQFSSADEYRYHEALVHPAMSLATAHRRVLILGGGDGLALREVLKYADVEHVTLVDLDPAMTDLSKRIPALAELNRESFSSPHVTVVNQDAMIWLETPVEPFDAVIIDFPDPNSFALGKLYTTRFYRLLQTRLTRDAAIVVQCTSPLMARQAYWCIARTMEASGLNVRPYHCPVPSFGVWGYVLARKQEFAPPKKTLEGLRFLNDQSLSAMFVFPVDLGPVEVEINRLDNQALVRYYEAEWQRWN